MYGSYQLSNVWPMRLDDEQTVYLDQFTGQTLARSGPDSYGTVAEVTEIGVLTHMGTQFGLLSRILMTLGCLLLIASIVTSLGMWRHRRPDGRAGLPKRPANPRLPRALAAAGLIVAVVYPLWGASALLVVLIDRLVIRRIRRLRAAFGLPATTA